MAATEIDLQTILTILGSLVAGGTVDRVVRSVLDRRRDQRQAEADASRTGAEAKKLEADAAKTHAEANVTEANAIVIHMSAWKELVAQHRAGEQAANEKRALAEAKLEEQEREVQGLIAKVKLLEAANEECAKRAVELSRRVDELLEMVRQLQQHRV